MKIKYTIDELYACMFKYNLQNETFEDGLATLVQMEKNGKVKKVESKDPAPMIGLNPFKGEGKKVEPSKRPDKFNDLLNHRVSGYKDENVPQKRRDD